ncbi:hypothetical protein LTR91_016404 [Friedmanniomyces endolithicus]|uniref:Calcineurin-like phosphoesterase domain-containing protein n=1 Tax=Friedmanniomyces endolithicus TaxID=329885 RepID=A0AAN6K8F9_9PEZI|nr:hypothetical protein LTR94_014497 [Friedmanniomyces endolithicus]KAK0773220.1 hypothetical protein LTR59_015366 [Friedmanniomyces endolithicus]KAK0779659.1 hypothetical protein LTR38_014352 [Friedmanniomyces endolithicus]KAK0780225.1 hypothetical protein LTR75_015091 [Friedmanniomyces endolithicus]KAK0835254.1 hypothetical protein LTR03_014089 [Friedmanniomyces endolithicus]
MSFSRIPLLLAFVYAVSSEQPSAPSPISAQLRELPWASGGLNILHTTDTHGWHGGHLQEAQYSADWGDYISFAHHLRKRADDDGSDLLLVDTGDRVEGNGLYDASDPKGRYTFDIFKQQRMDVITPGNHELYLANTSSREYAEVVPDFKDAYIASNLDIYSAKSTKYEPFAPRYRRFTTKNRGLRVLAFGFMFDFRGNANNTFVQPVEETVKEQWFQDALRTKDVDLFLVAGHVPVRDSKEYDLIYRAIRDVVWDTPIVFFGGHTHIRDFRKYEKTAYGIESGRYMETIGFLSISDLGSGKKDVVAAANPSFKRMYIDNNLYSMQHHSGMNASTFSTALGRNVSQAIHAARKAMHLDHAFGCAPQDYWLTRAPYPANDSLLSLLDQQVLPDTFQHLKKPTIVITNSGAIRFDIFKGLFTIDTTFLVSPFTSGFRKLSDVPYGVASQVLRLLNNEGPISLDDLASLGQGIAAFCAQRSSGTNADTRFRSATCTDGSSEAAARAHDLMPPSPPAGLRSLTGDRGGQQIPLLAGDKPTVPGYTTVDDAGEDGDDTVHQAIRFYDVPNCIGIDAGYSTTTVGDTPETVDLVYNEFIQDWVLLALRFLGKTYAKGDTEESLGGKTMTNVISEWVAEHWECEEGV